jgi:hypothetical protein
MKQEQRSAVDIAGRKLPASFFVMIGCDLPRFISIPMLMRRKQPAANDTTTRLRHGFTVQTSHLLLACFLLVERMQAHETGSGQRTGADVCVVE